MPRRTEDPAYKADFDWHAPRASRPRLPRVKCEKNHGCPGLRCEGRRPPKAAEGEDLEAEHGTGCEGRRHQEAAEDHNEDLEAPMRCEGRRHQEAAGDHKEGIEAPAKRRKYGLRRDEPSSPPVFERERSKPPRVVRLGFMHNTTIAYYGIARQRSSQES